MNDDEFTDEEIEAEIERSRAALGDDWELEPEEPGRLH